MKKNCMVDEIFNKDKWCKKTRTKKKLNHSRCNSIANLLKKEINVAKNNSSLIREPNISRKGGREIENENFDPNCLLDMIIYKNT